MGGGDKLDGDSASKLEVALLLGTSSSINDSFIGGLNLKVTVAVNLKVSLVWH